MSFRVGMFRWLNDYLVRNWLVAKYAAVSRQAVRQVAWYLKKAGIKQLISDM